MLHQATQGEKEQRQQKNDRSSSGEPLYHTSHFRTDKSIARTPLKGRKAWRILGGCWLLLSTNIIIILKSKAINSSATSYHFLSFIPPTKDIKTILNRMNINTMLAFIYQIQKFKRWKQNRTKQNTFIVLHGYLVKKANWMKHLLVVTRKAPFRQPMHASPIRNITTFFFASPQKITTRHTLSWEQQRWQLTSSWQHTQLSHRSAAPFQEPCFTAGMAGRTIHLPLPRGNSFPTALAVVFQSSKQPPQLISFVL